MKIITVIALSAFSFFVLNSLNVRAESRKLIASNENKQISFIELYSSESCSSCPPADKWISKLKDHPGLWKNFVPIVFHVDYWNHLGWTDKLSSKEMTLRQIDVSKEWPKPSVYTPAVVIDGKEFSHWRDFKINDLFLNKNNKPEINLAIFQEKDLSYSVSISGIDKKNVYIVKLAQLGMGLKSKITSGENSGENFDHNFIVLSLDQKTIPTNNSEVNFKLSKIKRNIARLAIVAWIEISQKPIALQAAGNFL